MRGCPYRLRRASLTHIFVPLGGLPRAGDVVHCVLVEPQEDTWVVVVNDVMTYAHYACVVDCADAMADAWDDTAGCAQPICLHENLLK